jgi:ubiquinone/menaquinone biosynthesis C-methylase UbiE
MWRSVLAAVGDVVLYGVLIVGWPVFRVVSLLWPRAYPAQGAALLEGPVRRRFAPAEQTIVDCGIEPGMRVLEIGPGGGYVSEAALARLGSNGRLVCLDLQADMLRHVRARLGARTPALVCASGSVLPFRAGAFDHVFLVSVLGEIPDQEAALRECRRVLRRGGTLAVSETFPDPDYVRQPVLRDRATRIGFQPAELVSHLAGYTQRLRA